MATITTGGATPATSTGTPVYMQQQQLPSVGLQGAFSRAMPQVDYNQRLSESLEHFMNPNSPLIQNARQRGIEMAATRGGVNSSIAAGAAERAALDQAVPLAQAAAGMKAGEDQVRLSEWAQQQGFSREMFAAPFQSSMNMLQRITEMGMQDPELYSPTVISGFNNFFNQQMGDMMRRYFGGQ